MLGDHSSDTRKGKEIIQAMLNIVMLCCMLAGAHSMDAPLSAPVQQTCWLCRLGRGQSIHPMRQPWLTRPSTLALFQTAAVIADGVTTRQMVNRGFVELDPITRPLIGRQPTYAHMIPLGAAEVSLSYLLARKYPKMRWLQISFTVTHGICALHNSRL